MPKIVIDLSELIISAGKAGEFAINQEGQEHIIRLVKARNQINELYENALIKLAEQAFEYDPNIKVIDSSKIRVSFAKTGKKYNADIEKIEPRFIKVVKSLNTDEIENYIKAHEKLPDGVKLVSDDDRGLSVRVKIKDDL